MIVTGPEKESLPLPTESQMTALLKDAGAKPLTAYAQKRAEDAPSRADWKAVEDLFAPDVVVNSPTNRVVNREDVMARMRSGQISAEPGSVDRREDETEVRVYEERGRRT